MQPTVGDHFYGCYTDQGTPALLHQQLETQRSLTQLFTQVVPRISLVLHPQLSFRSSSTGDDSTSQQLESEEGTVHYMAIPGSKDMVMKSTDLWEANCLPLTSSAQRPITLSTDSDSGFGSVDWGTPVRALLPLQLQQPINMLSVLGSQSSREETPVKSGCSTSHRTSTPRLMANVQQEVKELSKKTHRVTHGAHIIMVEGGSSQTRAWGPKLQGWEPSGPQGESWSSDTLSLWDHEFSTDELLERDRPSRYHPDGDDREDMMEVDVDGLQEDSPEEVGSHGEHSGEHSQDSPPS